MKEFINVYIRTHTFFVAAKYEQSGNTRERERDGLGKVMGIRQEAIGGGKKEFLFDR